mgnify:CR=1 FL=1
MTKLKDSLREKQEIRDAIAWFKLHDVEAYTDDDNGFYVVITHELNRDDIHLLISTSEVSYRADLWKEFKLELSKNER